MKMNLFNVCFVDAAKGSVDVHTIADVNAKSALKTAWGMFGNDVDPKAIQTIVKKCSDSANLDELVELGIKMLDSGLMDYHAISDGKDADTLINAHALVKSLVNAFIKTYLDSVIQKEADPAPEAEPVAEEV